MEKKQEQKSEKKIWIAPQLVVYGDIEKLTKEGPGGWIGGPPKGGGGSSSFH
jgi:hypothetical protein